MIRLWLSLAVLLTGIASAHAAQLIMTDQRGCASCAEFERDVIPTYGETELGRTVPLRVVDAHGPWPDDLADIINPRATPVFILVEEGKEIGRWAGYLSRTDFFTKFARVAADL